MGAALLPIALRIPALKAPPAPASVHDAPPGAAARRAFGHASHVLLVLGFFVRGFHVAFIAAHFPACAAGTCAAFTPFGTETSPAALGGATISVVGAANVAGTLIAGQLGARYPKPSLLSAIHGPRALVILLFVAAQVTPATVLAFSVAMGC